MTVVDQILDLARWAPSGDNTQPWRFEIAAEDHVIVRAFDTREHCVYDLTGHASQISVGAMLETMRIAAAARGYEARVTRRPDAPDTHPIFDVLLRAEAVSTSDQSGAAALAGVIESRSVQRRPLQLTPLKPEQKAALAASIGDRFELRFIESAAARLRLASLLYSSAWLRLTMKEAYDVHARVIEWGARFSDDKIPAAAVGLDPVTTKLMAWVMQDWRRVVFFNRFLAGTFAPRLQLDFFPAVACAAHIVILARDVPRGMDEYVEVGSAVQRLWLTATALGLQHQPELTPLIFAGYAREGRRFSADMRMAPAAQRISRRFEAILGGDAASRAVWMGRMGKGKPAKARSLRLPLERLIVRDSRRSN